MNPKSGIKILVLKTASSPVGANSYMTGPLLKLLRLRYGPVSRRPMEANGLPPVVCVSVDFDVTDPTRYDDNRSGTLALAELAKRYKIPITWAVCGKTAEADMKSYWAAADSFGGNEIGVHTYSHVDATATTAEEFRADVERCIQVLNLDSPKTFVFPWNREGHFEVLRELGFRVFRGKERAIGNPTQREGIWNVRPVYYVDKKSRGSESLIKRYIDFTTRLGAPFHLWTHPWSLVVGGDPAPMTATMDSVFAYIAEKRAQGALSTFTLGEVAEALDGLGNAEGDPSRDGTRIKGADL